MDKIILIFQEMHYAHAALVKNIKDAVVNYE